MNARTVLSVEEYLHISFPDLDREYRDGELVERSLPDTEHALTQVAIAAYFHAIRAKLSLFVMTELRMKLRDGLYLIPEVAVFWPNKPPKIPTQPPQIAIEILSEDDPMKEVRAKLGEFRNWGIANVWLVDPYQRRLYTWTDRLMEVATLPVPELGLTVTPEQIFD
jgi:Uma2 family endonuclease